MVPILTHAFDKKKQSNCTLKGHLFALTCIRFDSSEIKIATLVLDMGKSFGWLTNPVENPWSETALKSPMCSNKVVIKGETEICFGLGKLEHIKHTRKYTHRHRFMCKKIYKFSFKQF